MRGKGYLWDQRDRQRRIGRRLHPIIYLKQCLTIHLIARTLLRIHRGNLNGKFVNLHRRFMIIDVPITCRILWDCDVADRLIPAINFCHENDFIADFWVYFDTPELMDDVHIHLSVGIAMISIVNSLSEHLMIERIVQSKGEDLVENLKNLVFEIWRVNLNSNIVKNVLYVLKVSLIVRIHPFNGHPALVNGHFVYIFVWS